MTDALFQTYPMLRRWERDMALQAAPDPQDFTWGNLRVRALELAIQFTGSAHDYRAKDVVTNAEDFLKFLEGQK